jgi:DNA-binding transcriptional LysR family regulator
VQLRFFEYFIALAEERHFARAAARCHVTQPTLSAGIAMLETQLGKPLVLRDRRFIDLTDEGRTVLPHARQMVASQEELRREIDAAGPLRGELRLGTIPAAMPFVGGFVGHLRMHHPGVRVAIRQLSSGAILDGIASFALDAGLNYVEETPPPGMTATILYQERYRFATAAAAPLGDRAGVTLAEAVAQPLCLLNESMLNRRILDRHLARKKLSPRPVATTDSYLALLSMVARGGLSSIVTDSHAAFVGPELGIRLIEIVDLEEPNRVALLAPSREPLSPLARAAVTAARGMVAGQL